MDRALLVGTRKGLFVFRRNGVWKAASPAFAGVQVTNALRDPHSGKIFAALNYGHFGRKLQVSEDGGATWREIAAPTYPKVEGDETAPSVDLIWTIEAGGADMPGELWAGTVPGGLFRSTDHGESWSLVESLWNAPGRSEWFGGGYDKPGIHSICVDPRDPNRVSVAVSCGGAWLTEDRGKTWNVRSKGLYAAYMPPETRENPAVQDVHRMVQCRDKPESFWIQHHNGMFRSGNDLASWDDISPKDGSFGFAVAASPHDPDTAWFVPAEADQNRVPKDGKLIVRRTRDGGRSFETLSRGLPDIASYDLIYRHGLDIDRTGKALAIGSTTGGLWLSENEGDSWSEIPMRLPPVLSVRWTR